MLSAMQTTVNTLDVMSSFLRSSVIARRERIPKDLYWIPGNKGALCVKHSCVGWNINSETLSTRFNVL